MAMEDKIVENIEPPAEFPFPFPPYNIQKDFMNALFTTLNEGQYCNSFNCFLIFMA